ncbi:hypothetical protein [Sphaerisporangium fuscum]|uniref:hypothetical protein n=1 Tax=Sphaerisporangium fuscum TaxID=2835868 RepID=UPI001BDD1D68|nr:hypothetical protein [Sphaerisporangium fuscum]
MTVMLLGAALCAVNAVLLSPWLAAATTAVLGAGYGIAVVSGLLETQRMAGAGDLGDGAPGPSARFKPLRLVSIQASMG